MTSLQETWHGPGNPFVLDYTRIARATCYAVHGEVSKSTMHQVAKGLSFGVYRKRIQGGC